jgi:polyisoprenoid-binding protein YceI
VQARFSASSFESGNGARDAAVLSPRLLDAAAYPTLSFTSTQLVNEQGQWSLRGELEVRGVTRLVEARITALRAEAAAIRASARAGIDRYDFGITTYRGLAARRLTIDLDITARMEQS